MKLVLYIVLVALLNSAQAEVLAQWNFDDTTTRETALSVSHVVEGVAMTGLTPHESMEFAGLNTVPKSEDDGYGFGRNEGRQVLFLKRAEQYASGLWGSDGTTAVEGAPLSFALQVDAVTAVKIESVIVVYANGPNLLLYLQEADADRGAEALLKGERLLEEVSLSQPVVVRKGESKAFTINLNSGQFSSSHGINAIFLLGEVAP
ncbi:hypothetical protein N9Z14_02355 [Opitutales bacterium]|nr:hypothetical protein [Opitutales bacterium]